MLGLLKMSHMVNCYTLRTIHCGQTELLHRLRNPTVHFNTRIYYNIHRDLPTSNKCREVCDFSHEVIPLTHSELAHSGVDLHHTQTSEFLNYIAMKKFTDLCEMKIHTGVR